jgi:hypothetical protein
LQHRHEVHARSFQPLGVAREGVAVFCRHIAKLLQLLAGRWLSGAKPLFDLAFGRGAAFGFRRAFNLT